jgi:phage shock protein A
VVDAAERLSGTSLMRQAIREMDAALDKANREAEATRAGRIHADHQIEESRKQLATLKEQAAFAMSKGREDLAEAAIGRQLDIEGGIESLIRRRTDAATEERKIGETIASLKARRIQMQEDFAAFQAAQRAAAYDEEAPSGPSAKAERKASRAEDAFERAISAAGGVVGPRADTDSIAKVGEIGELQKAAAIAERLAALRGSAVQQPAARKRGGKKTPRG